MQKYFTERKKLKIEIILLKYILKVETIHICDREPRLIISGSERWPSQYLQQYNNIHLQSAFIGKKNAQGETIIVAREHKQRHQLRIPF